MITVQVQDTTGILRKTFIAPMKEKLQHRRSALKPNQISYYYIEPLNIRNQECMGRYLLTQILTLALPSEEVEPRGLPILGRTRRLKSSTPIGDLRV